MNGISGKTAIVVGGSRGLGRGIVTAFAAAGASVVSVARTSTRVPTPDETPVEGSFPVGTVEVEVADASDATVAGSLLDRYTPDVVVLVAGATPHMRALQHQTWETFSANWNTDVRIAFHWLREALLTPMRAGGRVVVFSSGAALNTNGSPLSGGYAGAKATQRFITGYAQDEANRGGLGITLTSVLPQFAPLTGVGSAAVQAYAARAGMSAEDFLLTQRYPLLTPEIAGTAIVELARNDATDVAPAYLLNGGGLTPLP